jgi:polyisoprenoid-binding protein YceI
VEGRAALPPAQDSVPTAADREDQTEVVVTVPVNAFDCGKDRMTRDLQEALKMEDHPEIRFELIHATVKKSALDTSAHWRRVEVLGALTIAGTKRLTRLSATGRALDANRFRVRGCHPIRMTYYNIDPPTKAFGLIKVKNEVEVQFDLLAVTESTTQPTPFSSVTLAKAPSCPSTTED